MNTLNGRVLWVVLASRTQGQSVQESQTSARAVRQMRTPWAKGAVGEGCGAVGAMNGRRGTKSTADGRTKSTANRGKGKPQTENDDFTVADCSNA